jgi:hypothetical protein
MSRRWPNKEHFGGEKMRSQLLAASPENERRYRCRKDLSERLETAKSI